MRTFPTTIINVIEDSGLNVNQISKVSGVSNTYLNKLLKKKINHPGKDKIASILLALNYSFTRTNEILADYDYMPLSEHDIPEILKNNRKRKFEGRIVPHFDHIYFELVLAALEKLGGTKILVKHRPSGIFIPMNLYMMKEFPTESDSGAEVFYKKFTHDVVVERKRLFLKNHARGCRTETYICRKCLEDSFERNMGTEAQKANPKKVEFGARYFANAVSASLKTPDQHIQKLIRRCGYFQFQLQDAYGKTPKISFTSERRHHFDEELDQLKLESFLSDAPGILDVFYNEIESCRNAVDTTDDRDTPEGFHQYIRTLFDKYGILSQFDSALNKLMESSDLTLY